METALTLAAQYLRMSTELQGYSLENQATAIQKYAECNGFEIVRTYSDAAKSGVVLNRRPALRQLLQDVASGSAIFRAILVYDVSRWGRFQDTDESAHYEFLCKLAGIPVHYCSENFANDGSLSSLIMKALKRTMAGEYSRELGVKVLAGQKRLAAKGFKQGGMAGYGLRRLLVSPERQPKHELASGERKSIASDRVVLVPGPTSEVQTVQEIYRMYVSHGMSMGAIARELNTRRSESTIESTNRSKWNHYAVESILTRPKYCGCCAFNRTSSRLSTPLVRLPKSEWVVAIGAFDPIVDRETFEAAQKRRESRTNNKSNEQLLQELKGLLIYHGRLSISIIANSPEMAAPATYAHRFGSLQSAYELIGHCRPEQFGYLDSRARKHALRDDLLKQIVAMFPEYFSIVRQSGRFRAMLRFRNSLMVSILIGTWRKSPKGTGSWRVDPVAGECKFVTLLARLDPSNMTFFDYHLFQRIDKTKQFWLIQNNWWLDRGVHLDDLANLRTTVDRLYQAMKVSPNEPASVT